MKNLRVIEKNLADGISITGTSTVVPGFTAANMLNNTKSSVWRTSGTTGYVQAIMGGPKIANCVAFAFANFTSTAKIYLELRMGGVIVYYSYGELLSAYTPLATWAWGEVPLGVNAFSQSNVYGRLWFPTVTFDSIYFRIEDPDNTAGYLDVSRLIIGQSWSPKYNPDYGVEVTYQDTSKQFRTDAGDLKTDLGTMHRVLKMNISNMDTEDRARLSNILRRSGLSNPLFISVFPERNDDPQLEQAHQLLGKLSSMSAMTASYYNRFAAPLEIEEI